MSYIRLREFKDRKPVQYSRLCIIPQGKYINGYYSGQLAKVHYVKELQRPPGYPEDWISCYQPKSPPVQFDHLTLANYISHRRMDLQPPKGWYKETTYQRAFSLPFYKFESDQILATPVLNPKPLTSLPKLF